mmetsp:Transcript_8494/g.9885  ORF Transcript_8494/g.9885 Transcript_8494/m.9885 type:complete len:115 (+) Transcript_8494:158-502(+)
MAGTPEGAAPEKKSFFGKLTTKKNADTYIEGCPQKKPDKKTSSKKGGEVSDDDSVDSKGVKKTWLGGEKKKPRAEYQSEIDSLKLQLVATEHDLTIMTNKVNKYKTWIRQAPHE